MELERVIELLKRLPEDVGLDEEENWDDSPETQVWRKEAIEAINFAVKALQGGEVVGTLRIDGKEYKIIR